MAKRVSVDRWMFTVTAILVFIGLVMVFSASAVMAKERYGSAYEFLLKQLVWAVAGLAAMFVAMRVDYKRLKHPGFVFVLLGFTTLFLISVFFLDRTHGTHRWFHLGPVSFQPPAWSDCCAARAAVSAAGAAVKTAQHWSPNILKTRPLCRSIVSRRRRS